MSARLYAALVHYPVVDKHGATVTTSITNLDIHDIARSARTYGIAGYFLVTPVEAQHWLVGEVIAHWGAGSWGEGYNSNRTDALTLVRRAADLGEVGEVIAEETGDIPFWVTTSARRHPHSISFADLRGRLGDAGRPHCLLFGTGWGLHPEVMIESDLILEPIVGPTPYNHLSVRSAAAIIFDRLLAPATGERETGAAPERTAEG